MFSYYKPSSEIFDESIKLKDLLSNADLYWAHTPPFKSGKNPETLQEHICLVNEYSKKLINAHGLDSVIDNLIKDYLSVFDVKDNSLGNFIKTLYLNTIIFHDYGKINENFQVEKMHNPDFNKKDSPITSRHSSLGAFIYLAKHSQNIQESKFDKANKVLLVSLVLMFSYSIFKHHSFQFNDDFVRTLLFDNDTEQIEIGDLKEFLKDYVKIYGFDVASQLYKIIGNENILNHQGYTKYLKSFSLYSLCRLNFSLLTASDYLATNEYMNISTDDFGIFSNKKIKKIFFQVSECEYLKKTQDKNYNKWTYEKLAIENYVPEKPTSFSGQNLNKLRQAMAIETIQKLRNNINENLFYIEAPTGGGKTNLSLLAVIEILKANGGKINKVFYVFPFTTLITQTYASIKEVFGLTDSDIVQLHSKAGFQEKYKEDDNYGDEKINYIHHLFANFPITLLTHIRFFDILKSNLKETNYLLHRMANSVVVIDELQTYSPKHWDKIIYFIKKFAHSFNIKFIIMSATLPKIDKLKIEKKISEDFIYLLPNAKSDYFQNPNFCNRVKFNFDLFERKDLELDELAQKLLTESKKYAEKDFGSIKPKNSVYTIIEFIFKKSAAQFYQIFKENDYFDEVFLLSGTILEPRRKFIINYLKNKINRQKRILLITTQVVEAGVDIDMDIGFKDSSLIDSDEQLAGRINRNVNKKDCILWLFNYDKAHFVYGKDKRLEISQNLKAAEYKDILSNKKFDLIYDKVIKYRNKQNATQFLQKFDDYKRLIEKLMFQSVQDKFKLIEQENISCFIPMSIQTNISQNKDNPEYIFNESEWKFLQKNHIYPNQKGEINGEEIFNLYIGLIEQKNSFIERKINQKIIQGILSNFIFSIFSSHEIEQQLVSFSDEGKSKYGFKYIQDWNKFYSIEEGMRTDDFKSTETQFL